MKYICITIILFACVPAMSQKVKRDSVITFTPEAMAQLQAFREGKQNLHNQFKELEGAEKSYLAGYLQGKGVKINAETDSLVFRDDRFLILPKKNK